MSLRGKQRKIHTERSLTMKVGTICKLRVECLGNEAGTLGVVFNDYGDGFQVIFENGNYDGFSTQVKMMGGSGRDPLMQSEESAYLEEVGFEESLARYKFRHVTQVSEHYRQGKFNRAWSPFWQKAAEQIDKAEVLRNYKFGTEKLAEYLTEHACRICGCTDDNACEGSCFWAVPGVCSKCIIERVPECIELLVACILATHQPETDKVCGDDSCSTCDLIKAARKMATALRQ